VKPPRAKIAAPRAYASRRSKSSYPR
jgi:hypothetical protein